MTTLQVEAALCSPYKTMNPGEIQPLFFERGIIDPNYLAGMAEIKRFLERWHADSEFRKQLPEDPYGVTTRYGLKVDPEEIRLLWDVETIKQSSQDQEAQIPLPVKRFRAFFVEQLKYLDRLRRSCSPDEPHFKAWRERQIARCSSQLGKLESNVIIHAPVCFELSQGCSVGCWFCGVSAPRLSDIFTYTPENAKLWQGVLQLVKEIIGPAAGHGFCYWATDPLDNPDYEKFCDDFREILGHFPQTTTALPLKDVARTRALLKLSSEKGCWLNCFSILSLKQLDRLHKEFTSEELMFVDLVLFNKESGKPKKNVGRARERDQRKSEKNNKLLREPYSEVIPGTIACVSGFLFNMVGRSVKLISPCNADDRWPLGYRVYDQGTFSNIQDLKALLEEMIIQNMSPTIRDHDLIRFRHDLNYQSLPDGFKLSTKSQTHEFRHIPYVKELGELIREGQRTAEEIALLLNLGGVPRAYTFKGLNSMFKMGVLDDEPEPR